MCPQQNSSSPTLQLEHRGCDGCIGKSRCPFGVLPDDTPLVERAFRKGQVLLTQGAVETAFRVVKVGNFLLKRRGFDHEARPVALLGSGDMLGTFSLSGGDSEVTSVATTDGRWCELEASPFQDAYMTHALFRQRMSEVYRRTFTGVADWAHVLRIRGGMAQMAAALLLLARTQRSEVVQLPAQSDLADLLGARRETVARMLGQLEAQGGLTRLDRRHCQINESALLATVGAN